MATALTGWLADIQWRLPFVVYLLPIVSIVLLPALGRAAKFAGRENETTAQANDGSFSYAGLIKYMLYYLFITFLVMAVSIYLPFLLGNNGYDSSVSGIVTSVFFLAMMAPGLFINRIVALLRHNILLWALLMMGLGLLGIYLDGSLTSVVIGCAIAGFGYGMAQPYIYDKVSSGVPASKVSVSLALVMTMNYVAIVISPFVIEFLLRILGKGGNAEPFLLNAVLALAGMVLLMIVRVVEKMKG